MRKIILSSIGFALMPLFVAVAETTTIHEIIVDLKGMADLIVPFLMVVAFSVFLWGIVKYIFASGDEEKRKNAKGYITYGLLGLFIMICFWGLILIVTKSFGIETTGNITPPQVIPPSNFGTVQ